jgi:hypothetical protein
MAVWGNFGLGPEEAYVNYFFTDNQ